MPGQTQTGHTGKVRQWKHTRAHDGGPVRGRRWGRTEQKPLGRGIAHAFPDWMRCPDPAIRRIGRHGSPGDVESERMALLAPSVTSIDEPHPYQTKFGSDGIF